MLNQYLPPSHIQIIEQVADWQSAVKISAEPLLQEGLIEPRYVEHIFAAHNEIGPYYVIAPQIAMPHSRPENGALAQALSLVVIKQGIDFGSENDPVKLVLMLTAKDNHSHIEMLSAVAELFSDEENIEKIIQSSSVAEISDILATY
ncbi:PTS sugar transporter subunit IIA [Caviibacterium pharyngocola]|uniref:PTS mannitol transporter subunit IIA n=1 Tax=Caviibacterium pharyngocola TaxID=28159 RepID=A0A2M8RV02_9PAST|nr:PTS sugar transporter subunit IIA [Caviibacterium pharyngocola]PJG82713.1 PTS mannitol transporter subunit IIA [Caviibacterium pharyngocola]